MTPVEGSIHQALLVVVTGRPGSGKTTLAHALAKVIRCPALCRDEFMEGFINTTGELGTPGDANQRNVYESFFDAVKLLLERRITLIAEAAFQHKLWAPRLEPLRSIARIRILICDIAPDLARRRHVDRGQADPDRQRFHHDAPMQADGGTALMGPWEPLHLDLPTMRVDTSDGHRPSIAEIVSFLRA